jgi:hypothetical protein
VGGEEGEAVRAVYATRTLAPVGVAVVRAIVGEQVPNAESKGELASGEVDP